VLGPPIEMLTTWRSVVSVWSSPPSALRASGICCEAAQVPIHFAAGVAVSPSVRLATISSAHQRDGLMIIVSDFRAGPARTGAGDVSRRPAAGPQRRDRPPTAGCDDGPAVRCGGCC